MFATPSDQSLIARLHDGDDAALQAWLRERHRRAALTWWLRRPHRPPRRFDNVRLLDALALCNDRLERVNLELAGDRWPLPVTHIHLRHWLLDCIERALDLSDDVLAPEVARHVLATYRAHIDDPSAPIYDAYKTWMNTFVAADLRTSRHAAESFRFEIGAALRDWGARVTDPPVLQMESRNLVHIAGNVRRAIALWDPQHAQTPTHVAAARDFNEARWQYERLLSLMTTAPLCARAAEI